MCVCIPDHLRMWCEWSNLKWFLNLSWVLSHLNFELSTCSLNRVMTFWKQHFIHCNFWNAAEFKHLSMTVLAPDVRSVYVWVISTCSSGESPECVSCHVCTLWDGWNRARTAAYNPGRHGKTDPHADCPRLIVHSALLGESRDADQLDTITVSGWSQISDCLR